MVLRNNTEILCALYRVSPYLGKLAQSNRKDVGVDMGTVETQNVHHHGSLCFLLEPHLLPRPLAIPGLSVLHVFFYLFKTVRYMESHSV